MYLISGTLFFIASFFLFIANHVLKDLYYSQDDPLTLFLAVIALFAGIIFYGVQYYRKKEG